MQIAADQLERQLKGADAQSLSPLYVLHGDEPLLLVEAGDAIRAAARAAGFLEREIHVVGHGFKWADVLASADNFSLFGGQKLIDIRLPNAKPGREGSEPLVQLATQPPENAITLISLGEADWQTQKTAWFTALKEAGVTVECNAPPLSQLPVWVAARLRRQQQSAQSEALQFIAEHVEGNLLAAHQEIQKLGLLYPAGELSLEQVREAVLNVARYDIEDFREAFLQGDVARCTRLLDALKAEGAPLPLLMWTCSSDVRLLAQASAARERGMSADEALKAARVFGARQAPYRNALERVPASVFRVGLQHAARIDRMVKGLVQGDVWDEVLQLAIRLSGRRKAAPRRPAQA